MKNKYIYASLLVMFWCVGQTTIYGAEELTTIKVSRTVPRQTESFKCLHGNDLYNQAAERFKVERNSFSIIIGGACMKDDYNRVPKTENVTTVSLVMRSLPQIAQTQQQPYQAQPQQAQGSHQPPQQIRHQPHQMPQQPIQVVQQTVVIFQSTQLAEAEADKTPHMYKEIMGIQNTSLASFNSNFSQYQINKNNGSYGQALGNLNDAFGSLTDCVMNYNYKLKPEHQQQTIAIIAPSLGFQNIKLTDPEALTDLLIFSKFLDGRMKLNQMLDAQQGFQSTCQTVDAKKTYLHSVERFLAHTAFFYYHLTCIVCDYAEAYPNSDNEVEDKTAMIIKDLSFKSAYSPERAWVKHDAEIVKLVINQYEGINMNNPLESFWERIKKACRWNRRLKAVSY